MFLDLIFDFLGDAADAVISGAVEAFSGSEVLGEMAAELAAELGTAAVAVGAGAVALGAVAAFAELTAETLKKFIQSKQIADQIVDALNNDPVTRACLTENKLENAPKYKISDISDMHRKVENVEKTADGQEVVTIRVTHPISLVYTDVCVAANTCKGIYKGMEF